jgi:hypothetical protein
MITNRSVNMHSIRVHSVFLDERLLLDVMIKYGSIQIFGGRYVNETDSAENT